MNGTLGTTDREWVRVIVNYLRAARELVEMLRGDDDPYAMLRMTISRDACQDTKALAALERQVKREIEAFRLAYKASWDERVNTDRESASAKVSISPR
jgi:hypothetical protein